MRYQIVMSVKDYRLHVICPADGFEQLPDVIRHLGPWQGHSRGEVDRLKPHFRLQLAEQGFVVAYRREGIFAAEQR